MMKQSLMLLVSLLFAACSYSDHKAENNQMSTIQPLYSNSAVQHFTSESNKDTLRVMINGETLISGQVYLKITDYKGNVVFWDNFPATAFIDHEGLIDPEKDRYHIEKQLDNFFNPDRFATASVLSSDLWVVPDSLRTAWESTRTDPEMVYFSYKSSKNGISQIAYAKNLKKVFKLKRKQTLQ